MFNSGSVVGSISRVGLACTGELGCVEPARDEGRVGHGEEFGGENDCAGDSVDKLDAGEPGHDVGPSRDSTTASSLIIEAEGAEGAGKICTSNSATGCSELTTAELGKPSRRIDANGSA